MQSNLCTTTTLGTQILWPLLTGCRCSEVTLGCKPKNGTPKWQLLQTGGRYSEVVVSSGLTVYQFKALGHFLSFIEQKGVNSFNFFESQLRLHFYYLLEFPFPSITSTLVAPFLLQGLFSWHNHITLLGAYLGAQLSQVNRVRRLFRRLKVL